ncbi:hypothetical protein BB560_001281 [Smittium megazygosporum]|uniref:Uncharacterized protein n=1 Tax=Smittium megazygosporum TaxID=133381 RepID=A0A2T9ZI14_9FUNG|nr:hypothetical protein BB560_002113 [Smittium megazygosporum]PVV04224.1 hypothetical protein BB560_001281 [Smittium megazygosporum]
MVTVPQQLKNNGKSGSFRRLAYYQQVLFVEPTNKSKNRGFSSLESSSQKRINLKDGVYFRGINAWLHN